MNFLFDEENFETIHEIRAIMNVLTLIFQNSKIEIILDSEENYKIPVFTPSEINKFLFDGVKFESIELVSNKIIINGEGRDSYSYEWVGNPNPKISIFKDTSS